MCCSHGGVAERLQVHVGAIFVSFEFDDDEIPGPINREQINAAATVFPLGKLFRDKVLTLSISTTYKTPVAP